MAERATIFELAQVYVEAAIGVPAAATKRFTGLMVEPDIQAEISTYRASGYRFPTVTSLNKEWTEIGLSGPITYSELVYLLCGLMKVTTPVNGTPITAKIWTFDIDTVAPNTIQTYTIEVGSSVRANKFSYGLMTGLTLNFNRDSCELDGTMIGKAISEGITMTALTSAAEIALVPVMSTQVSLKFADTAAGLPGASAFTRGFSASWALTDVFGPVWPLNGTSSFAAHVETEPTCEVTVQMEADNAGMALLANMRAGTTKFMRIEATGAVIGVGPATYSMVIDTALKISDAPPFDDLDGVQVVEWTGVATHDSTWGKATQVVITNELAALA